jgi:hypothetical protein
LEIASGREAIYRAMTKTDYSDIGPAVGEPFPDFTLPEEGGRPVRFHGWRRGRRALVVFYRSANW